MQAQPYLFYNGRCEEALTYYAKTLGAKVEAMMRFSEAPQAKGPRDQNTPQHPDKIMHANLRIGDSQLMASDGMGGGEPAANFKNVAITLTVDSDAEARRLYDALCKQGQSLTPLGKTFYASQFGMVQDPFGLTWMILAGQAQ